MLFRHLCGPIRIGLFNHLRFVPSTLPASSPVVLVQSRTASRYPKYGAEEGHSIKNEVRNEKWIRKRMRRPLGGSFRESQGLPANIMHDSSFIDLPDWSYADGRPGVLSEVQVFRLLEQKRYAKEIVEALNVVKTYEKAVADKDEKKQREIDNFLKTRLKPKGKEEFSVGK